MLREVGFSGFDSGKLSSTLLFLSTSVPVEIIGDASTTCKIKVVKCFMFGFFFIILHMCCRFSHSKAASCYTSLVTVGTEEFTM